MHSPEQASKTYRGTWDEIASHRGEIPPNAILELTVVDQLAPVEDITLAESLADLLEEAQHIEKDVPVQYEDPYKAEVQARIREKFRLRDNVPFDVVP